MPVNSRCIESDVGDACLLISEGFEMFPPFERPEKPSVRAITYFEGMKSEYNSWSYHREKSDPSDSYERVLTALTLDFNNLRNYRPNVQLAKKLAPYSIEPLNIPEIYFQSVPHAHLPLSARVPLESLPESGITEATFIWDNAISRNRKNGSLVGFEINAKGPEGFHMPASVCYNMEGFPNVWSIKQKVGFEKQLRDRELLEYPYCHLTQFSRFLPAQSELIVLRYEPPEKNGIQTRTEVWMPTLIDQSELTKMLFDETRWNELHGEPVLMFSMAQLTR